MFFQNNLMKAITARVCALSANIYDYKGQTKILPESMVLVPEYIHLQANPAYKPDKLVRLWLKMTKLGRIGLILVLLASFSWFLVPNLANALLFPGQQKILNRNFKKTEQGIDYEYKSSNYKSKNALTSVEDSIGTQQGIYLPELPLNLPELPLKKSRMVKVASAQSEHSGLGIIASNEFATDSQDSRNLSQPEAELEIRPASDLGVVDMQSEDMEKAIAPLPEMRAENSFRSNSLSPGFEIEIINPNKATGPDNRGVGKDMLAAQKALADKKYTLAIKRFDKILEKDAANLMALEGKAAALEKSHKNDNLAQLRQMALQHPENIVVLSSLGRLEAKKGDLKAALDLTQKVLAKKPHDTTLMLTVAVLLDRQGNNAEALRWYLKIPAPRPSSVQDRLDYLQSLENYNP